MNFVDLSKAFDCIHREYSWNNAVKFMESRIKSLTSWQVFATAAGACAVSVDGVFSEFFEIHSGVRQLRTVTTSFWHSHALDSENIKEGQGKERIAIDGKKLDLDFADDIALLEDSWEGMQTTKQHWKLEEAQRFGLVINVANTN